MSLKVKLPWASFIAPLSRNAPPILVFIYLLSALLGFAIYPLIASQWARTPSLGFSLDHRLVYTGSVPPGGNQDPQLIPNDARLVAVDDLPIVGPRQLYHLLTARQSGEWVALTFRDTGGEEFIAEISLQKYPVQNLIPNFIIPYVIGLVFLGCSIWMFALRRSDSIGRAYILFTATMSVGLAGFFDTYTATLLVPLWTISIALVGGALLNMTMLFPEQVPFTTRYPHSRWVGYLLSLLLAAVSLYSLYYSENPAAYTLLRIIEYFYAAIAAVAFLIWTSVVRSNSASPIVRELARLILLGAGISLGPMGVWLVLSILQPELQFSQLLLLPLAFTPVIIAYAILRPRLINIDLLLSRATLYAIISILAAVVYVALVSGTSIIFGRLLPPTYPILIGLMVFVFAIFLQPVRQRLQVYIDGKFLHNVTRYQEQLQIFEQVLTHTSELGTILHHLRHAVQQLIDPSILHIFIQDIQSNKYVPGEDDQGKPTLDVIFPANSVLVQELIRRRSSIFLSSTDTLPAIFQSERAHLALLGAEVFVPLIGDSRLIGWLALGPIRAGEGYTKDDLQYLESLGDQAALAVERAQRVDKLERRIHEMEVLTSIAQGVNITLGFDDILELIYAQTNKLIPTRDMRVILKIGHQLVCLYHLENDERLSEKEHVPLTSGENLEEVVINSRRALITDDFVNECRDQSILAHATEIFAWVGVPLNTGADSIGALSLGCRDPSQVITQRQANLLQAIADQAAGALVKAQLLQESERRALQLSTLNEVGRSLTSTLELKPLLSQILVSATDILNSEAGSLFIVDEQTNELIFEVTVGPVADELVGKRLPPGTGLVGRALQDAKPIIANDVRKTQGWSDTTDRKTGFVTRDLLVVPMLAHERAIGVIEVINKRDGSPYNADDEGLLVTFASQAAVAVENARLYTQTDEALTARVEELSVMQRIDRELNASLDLERSMRITLEWAMRQAHAEAGLAGLLNRSGDSPKEIHVMASQGFDQPFSTRGEMDGEQHLLITHPGILVAIDTGQPQLHTYTTNPIPQAGSLLREAKSQIAIPIRRTDQVIGMIVLESCLHDTYPKETMDFLSRLSDHAAIAISNAQLYAEVQAANIAKSDFVSLVSHELKTPMTAIRGYTDLLAKSVVGPINDEQNDFLNIVRSNVNRMATLVSDLADVSRIEAGRMRLDFSAINLAEVIPEVIQAQKAQIDEKSQTICVDLPTEIPAVWGDLNRITQVLTNLISNANKYTPREGIITIKASRSPDIGDQHGSSEAVCVSVQDTGFGISPEDQKNLFQKFFRSEDQNIRETAGTGLGLNITRHLVEMQGGRIWFESELGKGTTFLFTIPVVPPE